MGPQKTPASSSRMYSASPGGSETGSFDHGVSRFSRLFRLRVEPAPDSLARKPKPSLATTFTHGIGGSERITYSLPSGVKPPYPLSKRTSGAGHSTVDGTNRKRPGGRTGGDATGGGRRGPA